MLAHMKPVKKARPVSGGAARRGETPGQTSDVGVDTAALRRELLAWYDAGRRDMPWRRTDDPYAILVSEVMLQQTQVSRVEEYWSTFLERFPTVEALASATEEDVCSAWSGLGYYRRARNLRKAAVLIVESGGGVPRTAELLRELPGVGDYTAAAVASIAFGESTPVLDANVVRVLARLRAESEDVARAPARRRLRAAAAELLDPKRPGDFNQAMMELGAVTCSPTSPNCDCCPVAKHCLARAVGDPAGFPIARATSRTNEMHETVALLVRRGRVLLTTAPDGRGWWPGLWRLPRIVSVTGPAGSDAEGGAHSSSDGRVVALRDMVRTGFGLACEELVWVVTATYAVTTNRVTMDVLRCSSPRGRLLRSPRNRWFTLEEALSRGIPAADRRILEEFGRSLPVSSGSSGSE